MIQCDPLPFTGKDFYLQQKAFFKTVNSDLFQEQVKLDNAWNKIACIDNQGHFLGLSHEESKEVAATCFLQNVENLCKGLTCSKASYYEHFIHSLCLIATPNNLAYVKHNLEELIQKKHQSMVHDTDYQVDQASDCKDFDDYSFLIDRYINQHKFDCKSYNPVLTFTYPHTKRETLISRGFITRHSREIVSSIENGLLTYKMSDEHLQTLSSERAEKARRLLDESVRKSHLESDNVTLLQLPDTSYFIASKGNIENCYGFTWGSLVTLLKSCQLPPKDIAEYGIDTMEVDETTEQAASSSTSTFNALSRKRSLPTSDTTQTPAAKKRQYHP